MRQRPITTLFMQMSADGVISTNSAENMEWLLSTGYAQLRKGINNVLIDNKLDADGVQNLSLLSKKLIIVTANSNHAANKTNHTNVSIIYQEKLNLQKLLEDLYENHGCIKITIQTGGTLNEIFLRNKLFDYVEIVIAPELTGGGESTAAPFCESEFYKLGTLKLETSEVLEDSYIRVRYKVIG